MKKTFSFLCGAALLLAAASVNASAQTQSAFFLDNYAFNYRLNPALMSEKSFFGLGVGSINATLHSNVGLTSFIYPDPNNSGKLVTGFNNNISADQFLGNLSDSNLLGSEFAVNLLAIGSRSEYKMGTFEINVRGGLNAALPGDFFKIMKCGTEQGGDFDLSSLAMGGKAYLELAFGRAKMNENKNFVFGHRTKILLGLANINLNVNDFQLHSSDTEISAITNADARIACSAINWGSDLSNPETMFAVDASKLAPSGYGIAFDLGLVWKPFRLLTLSAGITDIGGMVWNYNSLAEAKGQAAFNGFENVDENTDFNAEIENVKSNFAQLMQLQKVEGTSSSLELLPFTATVGAKFRPFLNFISLGAVYTYHNTAVNPWYDARVGATLTPFPWLSLSANMGQSSFGDVCGAALSFNFLFLNFFVSADAYKGETGRMPQMISTGIAPVDDYLSMFPVNQFNYRINAGITMQLGTRHKIR